MDRQNGSVRVAIVSAGGKPTPSSFASDPRFNVVLEGYDLQQKILAIKAIRDLTGAGLKEAKDLSEALPATIRAGVRLAEAELAKAVLEAVAVGTRVSIQRA